MADRSGTTQSQRIIIWIIAVIMVVGTIGSFVVIIIGNNNSASDQAEITKEQTEYQAKVDAQTKQLSSQYYSELSQYQSQVAVFDKGSVTKLETQDLKVGDQGDALTTSSTFTAYYIGWNPSGKVFDSSIDGTSLKAPINVTPGGVIPGWTDGVVGMKAGGIRLLTIPSDQAYGATGSGDDIPANTPIKFVVMVIPTPDAIPVPQKLLQYYEQQQAAGQ